MEAHLVQAADFLRRVDDLPAAGARGVHPADLRSATGRRATGPDFYCPERRGMSARPRHAPPVPDTPPPPLNHSWCARVSICRRDSHLPAWRREDDKLAGVSEAGTGNQCR